nr:hypothetical protein [Bacteroides intestinalis]
MTVRPIIPFRQEQYVPEQTGRVEHRSAEKHADGDAERHEVRNEEARQRENHADPQDATLLKEIDAPLAKWMGEHREAQHR